MTFCLVLVAAALSAQRPPADGQSAGPKNAIQPEARQLVQLANQARAQSGASPLKWDPALAAAARQHCLRMAAEGPISHRYGGEPDVSERAGQAGAHFSLIEENVAIGPTPTAIHDEWMNSPGHRANLLNREVDSIGAAVVASRGVLYAVADYEAAVPVLTQAQVEAAVAALLRAHGIVTFVDPEEARAYCARGKGIEGTVGNSQPSFLMRWQNPDLTQLPQPLVDRLASRQFRTAAVGSCPPQDVEGTFTAYRVAALLY